MLGEPNAGTGALTRKRVVPVSGSTVLWPAGRQRVKSFVRTAEDGSGGGPASSRRR